MYPGSVQAVGEEDTLSGRKEKDERKLTKKGQQIMCPMIKRATRYIITTPLKQSYQRNWSWMQEKEEKKHVDQHEVYEECDIEEAIRITGKPPIATKWIDENKGDEKNFDIRCRWVAKQLKIHATEKSPFAATPPLETQKLLVSLAVTDGHGCTLDDTKKGMKLDFVDIRRNVED